MKKIALILLALLLVFTVISCSKEKTDAPAGMKSVSNSTDDYQLFIPEEWEVSRADGMVMAHVPETSGETPNFSVTTYEFPFSEEYNSIEKYYGNYVPNVYLKDIETNFPDVEFIESEKLLECEVDGRESRSVVFTATIGEKSYKFKQIITIGSDTQIYIFTYTANEKTFDTHLANINKIIEEFRFL